MLSERIKYAMDHLSHKQHISLLARPNWRRIQKKHVHILPRPYSIRTFSVEGTSIEKNQSDGPAETRYEKIRSSKSTATVSANPSENSRGQNHETHQRLGTSHKKNTVGEHEVPD
ncbi:hypothetical protein HZU67_03439 [Apis mellifera carnica]|nr:hypothetical protein HZU67_03439 [Apis mellifera carnica]